MIPNTVSQLQGEVKQASSSYGSLRSSGGPKRLLIILAVFLSIIGTGLMIMLPSKSVDVESVYGAF
jgi:hypothetical protein